MKKETLAGYLRRQSLKICNDNGCGTEHRCESYAYIDSEMNLLDVCAPDYFQGSSKPYAAILLPWPGTQAALEEAVLEECAEEVALETGAEQSGMVSIKSVIDRLRRIDTESSSPSDSGAYGDRIDEYQTELEKLGSKNYDPALEVLKMVKKEIDAGFYLPKMQLLWAINDALGLVNKK